MQVLGLVNCHCLLAACFELSLCRCVPDHCALHISAAILYILFFVKLLLLLFYMQAYQVDAVWHFSRYFLKLATVTVTVPIIFCHLANVANA